MHPAVDEINVFFFGVQAAAVGQQASGDQAVEKIRRPPLRADDVAFLYSTMTALRAMWWSSIQLNPVKMGIWRARWKRLMREDKLFILKVF